MLEVRRGQLNRYKTHRYLPSASLMTGTMLSVHDTKAHKLDVTSDIPPGLLMMEDMIEKKKDRNGEREITFYFDINNRASWFFSHRESKI